MEQEAEGKFRELTPTETAAQPFQLVEYKPENKIIRLPSPDELPKGADLPDFDGWAEYKPPDPPTLNMKWDAAYKANAGKHSPLPTVGNIVDEYARGKPGQPKADYGFVETRPDRQLQTHSQRQAQTKQGFDLFAGLDSMLSSFGSALEGLSSLFLFDWLFGQSDVAPLGGGSFGKPGKPMKLIVFLVSHDLGTTVRDALENRGLSIHPLGYTNTKDGQLYQFRFGVPVTLVGWFKSLMKEFNIAYEVE